MPSRPSRRAPAKAAKKRKTKTSPKKRPSKPAPRRATKARPPARREDRIRALTDVFQALGARQPADWAQRHIDEGRDELGRFVLLRALWLRLVEPGRVLAQAHTDLQAGPVIEKLMKQVSLADLDALVRFAQRTSVVDVCRVLDDPATNDDGIRWGVFRLDAAGLPLWPLDRLGAGLDESEP